MVDNFVIYIYPEAYNVMLHIFSLGISHLTLFILNTFVPYTSQTAPSHAQQVGLQPVRCFTQVYTFYARGA